MIQVTIEKKYSNISFDIDVKYRSAILGENGIGKTSILKAVSSKKSDDDWLSVHVPANLKIAFLSQIEENTQQLSGGEHTKQRLKTLFAEQADLYVLDEPTNNLDTDNIEWLKRIIIGGDLHVLFTSHNIDFIDNIAENIFYLDSEGVEKTKEKCSSYLETRKKKIEHEFFLYEENMRRHNELMDAARKAKQHSEEGSKWEGTDNDKFLRGFNRNAAGKSASTARKFKERAEAMKIEKPKYDPIPRVVINKADFHGHMFSLVCTALSAKRISMEIFDSSKILITGHNGIGKSSFVRYIDQLLNKTMEIKETDTFSRGRNFSHLYITQDWYEHLDNMTAEEYIQSFSLGEQDVYRAISYNYLDKRILHKKFKDISPGLRIKVLLGALSCLRFDLLIWDEPTNHLDVMTQAVLHDAFSKYKGALLVVSHDPILMRDNNFSQIIL